MSKIKVLHIVQIVAKVKGLDSSVGTAVAIGFVWLTILTVMLVVVIAAIVNR